MKIIGEYKEQKLLSRDVVILDKNVADFSLEKINGCSLFEAYKILKNKRKFEEGFFRLYWHGFLKNSPKYLQRIEIRDRWKNYVMFENLIATYLQKHQEIAFNDDWMYVGDHENSGYRIIVGHGEGILFSRFVKDDIFREIESTKLYLRRLSISKLQIFSNMEDLENAKLFKLDDVWDFADRDSSVKPIFAKDYQILYYFLWTIITVLAGSSGYMFWTDYQHNYDWTIPSNKIQKNGLTVYAATDKYNHLRELVENLDDNLLWDKIAAFRKKYKLEISHLSIDKNDIKIKTMVSAEKLKELQQQPDIKKVEFSPKSDFEELGVSSDVEVVVWLK